MKNFTRILALVLAMALCLGMLTACGGSTSGDTASADNAAQPADDTAVHTDVVFESGTGDARLAADTTADADKYGGVMKLNFNAATNSLDPAQFHNNQNYTPGYHIYESPIQVADDGTVWASVCTYELSEDGLTLTLTVRDNVLFHNGIALPSARSSRKSSTPGLTQSGRVPMTRPTTSGWDRASQ